MPAPIMEIIITDHVKVSMVENTRPRYSSETWRNSCEKFKTELTATAARDNPMKKSAAPKLCIWVKIT